jgi:hypothetical protein
MKKVFALVLFLVVMSTVAFAMDNNIGFGIGGNFASTNGSTFHMFDYTMNRYGAYAFVFLGISRFFEINLGYMEKFPDGIEYAWGNEDAPGEIENFGALQLGLYGKYPIPLGSKFVFFPTIGADFEYSLDDSSESYWKLWNELWLRAGIGFDFFLGQKFFLRTHLLAGYAFPLGGDPDWGVKSAWGGQVKLGLGWMF